MSRQSNTDDRAPKRRGAAGDASPARGAVDKSYDGLRAIIVSYEIKPGERINEVEIARRLGVSRTPLREALNRMMSERLIDFEPSIGFVRPRINLKEIADLYELRLHIEALGVRLAIERADEASIDRLAAFWAQVSEGCDRKLHEELISDDEEFHERLIALSGNDELVHTLRNINARIHFVRWVDYSGEGRHEESYQRHLDLILSVKQRNESESIAILREIIERRNDEILSILKEGAAKLYIS